VTRAAVALGSNLGDRAATLAAAVADVAAQEGVEVVASSGVYESAPVGGPADQPAYLNAVVVVETDLTAAGLLMVLQQIETAHGRRRVERWGPRTLDLDLLAFGALRSDAPQLTVPHPRARERAFVLVPWAQVDPTFEVPGLARVADLLAALPAAELAGVRAV